VYRWSFTLDQEELARIVRDSGGKDIGKILDIERIDPDAGERTKVIVLKGEKGSHEMETSVFRKLAGTARMKSVAFEVKKSGSSFEILGSGWGHGVGMCQWGAAGMGNPTYRYTAQEILQHYYQETKLLRIY
jgi:stage II sporulation protein D